MKTDYISRDEILEKQKTLHEMQYGTGSRTLVDVPAVRVSDIESIPAAKVRPVVPAKWIALDIYRGMGNYKCSACNQECYVPECMGEPMYIYCPNCGAKMGKSPRE